VTHSGYHGYRSDFQGYRISMSESHRVALVTKELGTGVTSQPVFPGYQWIPGCHG